MQNYESVQGGICAAAGFKAAGVHCGIRPNKTKKDLMMVLSDVNCSAAAVYTQNKVKGAPLTLTRKNIADGYARGILCNSGNANTCAPNGLELAQKCAQLAADATSLAPSDFVIASTGVIGQEIPIEPFEAGIPELVKNLSSQGSADAGMAIMTTDTRLKEFAVQFDIGSRKCHVGGVCKGSGMININMATTLIFVTTDVAITPEMLQKAIDRVVPLTLNQVCIDGDTSTNDMAVVLASGLANNAEITSEDAAYDVFCGALQDIMCKMSRSLAGDGEGATKLLDCTVSGATDDATARAIAKSVISSSLFKSAMFGADANWGRVLCAVGYTPGDFPVDNISLTLKSSAGSIKVCEASAHYAFSEDDAAHVLFQDEIEVLIDMGTGSGMGKAWGCDLTYDYVKINGDYRT